MYSERIDRMYRMLEEHGYAAAAMIPSPTFTYLTGLQFGLDERPKVLILQPGETPVLILPSFEAGQLEHSSVAVQPYKYSENPDQWPNVFRQACDAAGINGKQIAIEALHLRARELFLLQDAAPQAHFRSGAALFDSFRMQKDEQEIALMRKAAHIAQEAFKATVAQMKAGMTEKEVAAELVMQLLRQGSDSSLSFSPIVGAGPNGANPHAHLTDARLQPGQLVVIDWGARYQGYCSDITRTLAVGEISPALETYARVVAAANQAGRLAARTGATAAQVDRAARAVIEEAGFGPQFIHRTGHGLGMEVHEPPYITAENEIVLQPGMTFTVEPGVYFPGFNGVRIEDDVVAREDGGESLTNLTRDLFRIE